MRSTDNGINWTQMAQTNNNSFKNTHVYSLAINGGGQIFAGTVNDGIFRSTDNGNEWVQINSGLTDNYVTSLAINSAGFVFAGTNKGGVFRSTDKTTSVKGRNEKTLTNFSLHQNYPNPFNPTTTIKYFIPAVETRRGESLQNVLLKVYDTLGDEVTTLVDAVKAPGNYEVKFDGSNLSSGVYFYRLQAGQFNETKKFVLLK
ncbi:MAG: T9SS C-terminal target domain-containing protein [Stygiobacter sp.]|nr:MAG: T9SS C-terminal target domain-containing protein [Stygiobacter sp.]